MRHPERVEHYLEHVALAIERVMEYVEPMDRVEFQQTQWAQDASIRNIEIIGEAASRIHRQAPEFVAAHPTLPWNQMRGMRNRLIHNYFDVDVDVLWSTIKEDLPLLKQQIDDLLVQCQRGQEHEPEQERS